MNFSESYLSDWLFPFRCSSAITSFAKLSRLGGPKRKSSQATKGSLGDAFYCMDYQNCIGHQNERTGGTKWPGAVLCPGPLGLFEILQCRTRFHAYRPTVVIHSSGLSASSRRISYFSPACNSSRSSARE